MKLLRTTALTAALMTAAIPLLTSDAQAWRGWRGGGWGWPGAALGAAAVGTALAARSYYGYGYGYPAYGNYDQPRPCLGFFFMAECARIEGGLLTLMRRFIPPPSDQ